MDELTVFGTIVLVVAGGLLLALLLTKVGERFPVPEPLIFLLLAAVASDVVFARARRRHKHQGIDFEIEATSQYRER